MKTQTTITVDMVKELLPGIVNNLRDMANLAWTFHAHNIEPELEALTTARDEDPTRHAQRCVISAILSPGCRLDVNLLMARNAMEFIGQPLPDMETFYQHIVKDGGCGRSTGPNVRNLYHSFPYINELLDDDDMTKETLLALRKSRALLGIGHKTASWAMAQYDPGAPVFTIDVHMLRWLCRIADQHDLIAGTMLIRDNAYAVLEAIIVGLLQSHDAPMLGLQWAAWNVESGGGEHRSLATLLDS